MPRHSYREHDYTFGQAMLRLRTSIGLTQAGLAKLLGVSRRTVGEWEGGLTYPKAEHLQHFIGLCVQQHVFESEREEEEIRALWKTAHQRVLLDEAWLAALLTPPSSVQLSPQAETPLAAAVAEPATSPRVDWVGALDVSHFSGREVEVAELSHQTACFFPHLSPGSNREETCHLLAADFPRHSRYTGRGVGLSPGERESSSVKMRRKEENEHEFARANGDWRRLSTGKRRAAVERAWHQAPGAA